jgi:hypothetical protein
MTTKKATSKTKPTKSKERAVLVTTSHRGVFFGYSSKTDGDTIKLRDGRNVVYWSAACKGFMGLAANGPVVDCRIGPSAQIELRNITSVTEVTDGAAKAFEAAPWR